MTDKELYRQKKQAQLDKWKAEVDRLKAKASEGSADAQMELNKQVKAVEGRIEEGRIKLAAIARASEDEWESIRDDVDSAWDSITSGFNEALGRFAK